PAPEGPGGPRHLVARHPYSKPADVHPEEGQCKVPAEVEAEGQPQVAAEQVGVPEEDTETRGNTRTEQAGIGVLVMQQTEDDADREDGRPRTEGVDQDLQAVAAEQHLFAERADR